MMMRALYAIALTLCLAAPAVVTAAEPIVLASNWKISVDATSLQVKNETLPPTEYPHVGHLAPVTFEQALQPWAASHFILTGGSVNSLRVTLREANIVEELLPVRKGIAGWFRKDQAVRYSGDLEIAVSIVDPNGQVLGMASGRATVSETLPEGSDDADRRALWRKMVETAYNNLDREFFPNLNQSLAAYVR